MKLRSLSQSSLKIGDVVLGRGVFAHAECELEFVIIENINHLNIYITPFKATFDDSDTSDQDVLCRINFADRERYLARAVLEKGDELIHRGRRAVILECNEGDWHIKIKYNDPQGGEFYGNMIWMDLSPALKLIDLNSAWPTLT